MNRYNFGNATTNAIQVANVSAFTGSNFYKQSKKAELANAASGLNNLTFDEVRNYGKYQADRMRDAMNEYYQSKDDIGEENIDDIMSDGPIPKTEQGSELNTKINNDIHWLTKRTKNKTLFIGYKINKDGDDDNADV